MKFKTLLLSALIILFNFSVKDLLCQIDLEKEFDKSLGVYFSAENFVPTVEGYLADSIFLFYSSKPIAQVPEKIYIEYRDTNNSWRIDSIILPNGINNEPFECFWGARLRKEAKEVLLYLTRGELECQSEERAVIRFQVGQSFPYQIGWHYYGNKPIYYLNNF